MSDEINLFPEIEEHAETKPDNIRYAFDALNWFKGSWFKRYFDEKKLTNKAVVFYHVERGDLAFVPQWAREEVQIIQDADKRKKQKICFDIPELESTFAFTTNEHFENACFEIFWEGGQWTLGFNECDYSIQHYQKSGWFDLVSLYAIRKHLNNPPKDLVEKGLWQIKDAPKKKNDNERPNRRLLTIERKAMVEWLEREGYRPRFFL
jgi:hypothetical protein